MNEGEIGGARLCGSGRSVGSVYVEIPIATNGAPIETFYCDPPKPISLREFGVAATGQGLIEKDGVHHLIDHVGSDSYPLVTDFFEEAKRRGFSRKIRSNFDFSKLSVASKILFVHSRGRVTNHADYATSLDNFSCPCGKEHLAGNDCIGLHWHVAPGPRERNLARGQSYNLMPRHPMANEPEMEEAIVAALPIHQLAIIADSAGVFDNVLHDAVKLAGLPVRISRT